MLQLQHSQLGPAVAYVQKVRQRCDPETYRQFLDIFSRYHHAPDTIDEEEVSKQIARLFKDAPDLLSDFRYFMPERSQSLSDDTATAARHHRVGTPTGDMKGKRKHDLVTSNSRPTEPGRNLTDVQSYLDAVKNRFHDQPDVYNQFRDVMNKYKYKQIDTSGLLERVATLFVGDPSLIERFNILLKKKKKEHADRLVSSMFVRPPTKNSLHLESAAISIRPVPLDEPSPHGNDPSKRPINPRDVVNYLYAVKNELHDQPEVYDHFVKTMRQFKSQQLDVPSVIKRVPALFQGHPSLIQGFNRFIPAGYHIEFSVDGNRITVTTPTGTIYLMYHNKSAQIHL